MSFFGEQRIVVIDNFNYRGPHDATQTYAAGDAVGSGSTLKVAIQAVPANTAITDTNYWVDGLQGPRGEVGYPPLIQFTNDGTTYYLPPATSLTIGYRYSTDNGSTWSEFIRTKGNPGIQGLQGIGIEPSNTRLDDLIQARLVANGIITEAVVQNLINNTLRAVTDASIFAEALFSTNRSTWSAQLSTYRYVWLRKIEEDRNTDNPEVVIDLGIVSGSGSVFSGVYHDDTLIGTGINATNPLKVAKPAADTGAQVNPKHESKFACMSADTADGVQDAEIGFYNGNTQVQSGNINTVTRVDVPDAAAALGADPSSPGTDLDAVSTTRFFGDIVANGGQIKLAIVKQGTTNIVYLHARLIASKTGGWSLTGLRWFGSETIAGTNDRWNIVASISAGFYFADDIPDLASKLGLYVLKTDLEGHENDAFASYTNGLFGSNYFPGNFCLFDQTTEPTDDTNAIRQPDIVSGSGVIVFHLRDDSDPNKSFTPETPVADDYPINKVIHISAWSPYKPDTYLVVTLTSAATLVGTDNTARLWAQASWVEVGNVSDVVDDGDYFRFSENIPSQLKFDLPIEAVPSLPYQYARLDGSNVTDELKAAIQGANEAKTLTETFRVDVTNVSRYVSITLADNNNPLNTMRIRLPSTDAGQTIDNDLKRLLLPHAWVKVGGYTVDITSNATRSLIGTSLTYSFNFNPLVGSVPTGSTPVNVRVIGEDVHRGELLRFCFENEDWEDVLQDIVTIADDDVLLIWDKSARKVKRVAKSQLLTKAGLYAAVKAILQASTNVTITADDTDNELDIAAAGGGATFDIGSLPVVSTVADSDYVPIWNVSETTADRVSLNNKYYPGMARVSDTEFWVLNYDDRRIDHWVNGSEVTADRISLTSGKAYETMFRVSNTDFWAFNYTDNRLEHWVSGSEVTADRVSVTSNKYYYGMARVSNTEFWLTNQNDRRIEHWVSGSEVTADRVSLTYGNNYYGLVRVSNTDFWVFSINGTRLEHWVSGSEVTADRISLTSGRVYYGLARVSDTDFWLLNDTDNRIEHFEGSMKRVQRGVLDS